MLGFVLCFNLACLLQSLGGHSDHEYTMSVGFRSVLLSGGFFTGTPTLRPRRGFLAQCAAPMDHWDVFPVMSR